MITIFRDFMNTGIVGEENPIKDPFILTVILFKIILYEHLLYNLTFKMPFTVAVFTDKETSLSQIKRYL